MTSHERKFQSFVVCYNKQRKIPNWTFECITEGSVECDARCRRTEFDYRVDPVIGADFQSKRQDYLNSGYDHGHMAAARNHQEFPHCEETFYLSNMAPQLPGFNRGVWKTLENHARDLTAEHERVYIFSGTLFLSNRERGRQVIKHEVIGEGEVHVPTHFFKIISKEMQPNEFEHECYVLKHEDYDEMTLAEIEEEFENEIEFVNKKGGFNHERIFQRLSAIY